MSADAPIVSRPYHAKMACPACCFGEAQHADWCHPSNATVTFTVEATWPTPDQQAEMRRGLSVEPPTASPWEDPWAKRKE